MSGFGKDLKNKRINSKLYRKVGFDNFHFESALCCSTPESSVLISHGEVCFVFEAKERQGLYCPFDADAGRNFGYDEFRVEVSEQELDYIVYPNFWDEEIEETNPKYNTDEDPFVWIDNLKELGLCQVISESEYKKLTEDKINFNF